MKFKAYLLFFVTVIFTSTPSRSQYDVLNTIISSNSSISDYESHDYIINLHTVSIINFIVCPVAIFLHSSLMYLISFSSKKHNYKNVFFKLMLFLSFNEIYCSVFLMFMATCNLTGTCPFGETFNIFLCSFAQYIIYFCMNLNMLVALNRFTAVVLYNHYANAFSTKKSICYILVTKFVAVLACIPTWIYRKKYVREKKLMRFLV